MSTAIATYSGCRPDNSTHQMEIDSPANRTTPEAVASYLRFGGRISDSVQESFTWEGQTYDAMRRSITYVNGSVEGCAGNQYELEFNQKISMADGIVYVFTNPAKPSNGQQTINLHYLRQKKEAS